jgi:hypothetical protein
MMQESSKNWCRRHGVEEQRLYEMVKLQTQFEQILIGYMGPEEPKEGQNESDRDEDIYEQKEDSRKRRRKGESDRYNDDNFEQDGKPKQPFWKVTLVDIMAT